ncbi:MAG: flavin reductase family protein [Methanomassiliicoccales archaeon]|nr:flavin reductase family protein [Methanomassiliicoccales archaeon]
MEQKVELTAGDAIKAFPAFPVALVAMGNGERNIITVGIVHAMSLKPAIVGVGIMPSRHSHKLMQKYDDFSINLPGKELVKEVMFCGTKSGKDVDKFKETNLTPVKGKKIASPCIGECLVVMECKKTGSLDIGDRTWFFGEIVHAEATKDYTRDKGLLYWGGEFRLPGEVIWRR